MATARKFPDRADARHHRLQRDPAVVHEVVTDGQRRKDRLRELAKRSLRQCQSAKEHRIPMLPRIAARALQMANDPAVSIKALESVIQPDPMLMARMLSIANSPVYAAGKQITNLRTAMMMLGVGLVRDILYQTVAEAHIFRGASEAFLRQQRLHGVAVAYLARDLCGHVGLDKDYAFLSGLMHDIGAVVIRQTLADDLPGDLGPDGLQEISELIHPHVGKLVCERWKLPGVVVEAARRHHRYREYDGKGGGYSQIGHVIAVAERLAAHAGLDEQLQAHPMDDAGRMKVFELGLAPDVVESLITRAEALADQIKT